MTGKLDDAREADRRGARSGAGHVAALPPVPRRRPRPHRAVHAHRQAMNRRSNAMTDASVRCRHSRALVASGDGLGTRTRQPAGRRSKGELQVYTLAVPTEKDGRRRRRSSSRLRRASASTRSSRRRAGSERSSRPGSGENAVITKVTWSGGKVPTGEDAAFSFLAAPGSAKTYTFGVRQTYSDGSVVDWNGPESSDTPAPTIEAKSLVRRRSAARRWRSSRSSSARSACVLGVVALFAGGRRALA